MDLGGLAHSLPPDDHFSTLMSLILSGGAVNGFPARIVKSASFPTSIEPLTFSSKVCQAASRVKARRASSGIRRYSGPRTSSFRVFRLTAAKAQNYRGVLGNRN